MDFYFKKLRKTTLLIALTGLNLKLELHNIPKDITFITAFLKKGKGD